MKCSIVCRCLLAPPHGNTCTLSFSLMDFLFWLGDVFIDRILEFLVLSVLASHSHRSFASHISCALYFQAIFTWFFSRYSLLSDHSRSSIGMHWTLVCMLIASQVSVWYCVVLGRSPQPTLPLPLEFYLILAHSVTPDSRQVSALASGNMRLAVARHEIAPSIPLPNMSPHLAHQSLCFNTSSFGDDIFPPLSVISTSEFIALLPVYLFLVNKSSQIKLRWLHLLPRFRKSKKPHKVH